MVRVTAYRLAMAMQMEIKKIRFSILLILLVLMIIAIPFLRGFLHIKLSLDIFTTAILIAAIWATGLRRHRMVAAICLALPYLLLTWVNYLMHHPLVLAASHVVGILFFGYVIYSILKFIISAGDVTREVIFAAIVSYLLLAVIWSYGYSALELVYPGSFNIPAARVDGGGFHFLYFSFVTITTLGYGDITPLTDKASSLAIVEALVGQIYLVVLVAWLVGMHVSRKSR